MSLVLTGLCPVAVHHLRVRYPPARPSSAAGSVTSAACGETAGSIPARSTSSSETVLSEACRRVGKYVTRSSWLAVHLVYETPERAGKRGCKNVLHQLLPRVAAEA